MLDKPKDFLGNQAFELALIADDFPDNGGGDMAGFGKTVEVNGVDVRV